MSVPVPATWYFDFVSPYAYLQSRMLERFAGKATIAMKPVLFAGLLGHWKTVGPAETPPKRLWTYRFCTWFGRAHGFRFKFPPRHPFNPLKPLRLAMRSARRKRCSAIFDFIWAEGRDPSDPPSGGRSAPSSAWPIPMPRPSGRR